jgi:hypothetical protein
MITANDALQQISAFLPENYRIYFLTGIIDLRTIRQQYPDADTGVPAKVRSELRELRQSVLSGSLDTGLANKYLTGAGGGRGGGRATAAQQILDRVLVVDVQPDPLGRTGAEAGFGRDTRQAGLATGAEDVEPGEMAQPSAGREGAGALGLLGTPAGTTPLPSTVAAPSGVTPSGPTGPSGPTVVTDVAEVPADANIPEDWRTAAAQAYPQYYAIVRNIPEIASLLERAVAESFTPEEFQAQLEQTGWWQQTTASAREWEISGQRDPATQQRLLDEQRLNVRSIALNTFGVNLSDESLNRLSEDSLKYGWSSAFLSNAIGDLATQSTAGVSQLRQGYIGQNIRQTARKYGVTLSDVTFNSFVNRIAVGQETADSFENYALNIARVLYPTLQSQFDAGLTFDDAVDPYRQIAASTLELAPDQIDFTDPKWLTPITYMPDPATGQQRLMNLAEWGKELRTNRAYGYEFTTNAKNQAYSVVETLGNLFGRI